MFKYVKFNTYNEEDDELWRIIVAWRWPKQTINDTLILRITDLQNFPKFIIKSPKMSNNITSFQQILKWLTKNGCKIKSISDINLINLY